MLRYSCFHFTFQARDRKFLGDLASDKFYLEDVLEKLDDHTNLRHIEGCGKVKGKIRVS